MINIVPFWAPRPAHPQYSDHGPLLELQRRNCAKYGLRQIVIGDAPPAMTAAPFWGFCVPNLPDALMAAILHGQLAYLESRAFDADTILTGTDCLVGRDPRPVFDGSFDLAVTTGAFADCILNTGAIFCPRAARDRIVPIFRRALAAVGEDWGDDQRALAGALDATLDHGIHDRDGVRAAFLPVVGFNQAPRNERDPVDAVIVHFRGARKSWMARWAARFAAV